MERYKDMWEEYLKTSGKAETTRRNPMWTFEDDGGSWDANGTPLYENDGYWQIGGDDDDSGNSPKKPPILDCPHNWKHYMGFNESYEYCTKCDEKRKPQPKQKGETK